VRVQAEAEALLVQLVRPSLAAGSGAAVKCPFCGSRNDGVSDSREVDKGARIWRRRLCGSCGKRYTTTERIAPPPAAARVLHEGAD